MDQRYFICRTVPATIATKSTKIVLEAIRAELHVRETLNGDQVARIGPPTGAAPPSCDSSASAAGLGAALTRWALSFLRQTRSQPFYVGCRPGRPMSLLFQMRCKTVQSTCRRTASGPLHRTAVDDHGIGRNCNRPLRALHCLARRFPSRHSHCRRARNISCRIASPLGLDPSNRQRRDDSR